MSVRQGRERIRPPRLTRLLAAVIAAVGLLLVIGSLFDQHPDGEAVLVGVALLVLGGTLALARADCSAAGVTYWNLRKYHVPATQVAAVRVERRGFSGTFPTLVVYRREGRPLVLRGVQDFRSEAGIRRQSERADRWNRTLRL